MERGREGERGRRGKSEVGEEGGKREDTLNRSGTRSEVEVAFEVWL